MVIVVKSLHSGKQKHYKISRMYDFDQLVMDFGPTINHLIGDFSNVRAAADRVAEYLSNHHLDVEIIDPEDHEEIYDPNVEVGGKSKQEPKRAIDLKDILEAHEQAEYVDIPEYHTMNAATHRWGKS